MTSSRQLTFKKQYDITIAGAGVFGAAMAWEASHRGLSVLLVDKEDFSASASANSLKTIHGGLRYLQQVNLLSTRSSAKERKAWLKMAPDLVQPLDCVLPTSGYLMKSRLILASGLLLYNLLTLDRNAGMPSGQQINGGKLISKAAFSKLLPEVKDNQFTGAAYWQDAQGLHTERLIYLMVSAAQQYDADCYNYAKFLEFSKQGDDYRITLEDQLTGKTSEVTSRILVDCSANGRVVEKQLGIDEKIQYVSAINLIVDKPLTPVAVGLNVQDESIGTRALFLSPWRDKTLVGTWYFKEAEPSEAQLSAAIEQVNTLFLTPQFGVEDVCHIHLGHLPASAAKIKDVGPDYALLSQAQVIDWSNHDSGCDGLYTIRGTKYTLARREAQLMIDRLAKAHHLQVNPSKSKSTCLYSNHATDDGKDLGLTSEQIRLISRYFRGVWPKIREIASKDDLAEPVPGFSCCPKAVVRHCISEEQAYHLDDLLTRRLPLGDEGMPEDKTIDYCLNEMATFYKWDLARQQQEKERLNAHYQALAKLDTKLSKVC